MEYFVFTSRETLSKSCILRRGRCLIRLFCKRASVSRLVVLVIRVAMPQVQRRHDDRVSVHTGDHANVAWIIFQFAAGKGGVQMAETQFAASSTTSDEALQSIQGLVGQVVRLPLTKRVMGNRRDSSATCTISTTTQNAAPMPQCTLAVQPFQRSATRALCCTCNSSTGLRLSGQRSIPHRPGKPHGPEQRQNSVEAISGRLTHNPSCAVRSTNRSRRHTATHVGEFPSFNLAASAASFGQHSFSVLTRSVM